jgi:hypothetical protein
MMPNRIRGQVPFVCYWQRMLIRRADMVVVLSSHVAEGLRGEWLSASRHTGHGGRSPPFAVGTVTPLANMRVRGGFWCFGRLRAYKGLDLLAEALRSLGSRMDWEIVLSGRGRKARRSRRSGCCRGERREPVGAGGRNRRTSELGGCRGAAISRGESGAIAPMALAAGRPVVATRVGGFEQLADEPLATLCAPDAASLAEALTSVSCASRTHGTWHATK